MNREATGLIARIEAAIVARLQAELPGMKVDAWPDDMGRYQLLHNKGAVLVSYRGRSQSSADWCPGSRLLSFAVTVAARNLRQRDAHQGVYDMLEAVESAIDEWNPGIPGADAFMFVRDSFAGEDSGIWTYTAMFNIEVLFKKGGVYA